MVYKNFKLKPKITEASIESNPHVALNNAREEGRQSQRRYPVEVHDTPTKDGYYRGVNMIWMPRNPSEPDVELHYDAFRSPRFEIKVNGKKVFGTEGAAEARSYLRKNFGIRWNDPMMDQY
jgi:hypothetical protein